MQSTHQYSPITEASNLPCSRAAVHEHYIFKKKAVIWLELFIFIVEIAVIIAMSCITAPLWSKLVAELVSVPVLILMGVYHFSLRVRVDELNRSILFLRKAIIPLVWRCKDRTFGIDEISQFTLEKIYAVGKKNFWVYVNFNNGKEKESVWIGQDPKCSEEFDPQLDITVQQMNRWITKV